jgi:hypothetical protein
LHSCIECERSLTTYTGPEAHALTWIGPATVRRVTSANFLPRLPRASLISQMRSPIRWADLVLHQDTPTLAIFTFSRTGLSGALDSRWFR